MLLEEILFLKRSDFFVWRVQIICVASDSVRFCLVHFFLNARKLERERKSGGRGEGRGEREALLSPPLFRFSFSSQCQKAEKVQNPSETLATQANHSIKVSNIVGNKSVVIKILRV